jgi:hypothetical protein
VTISSLNPGILAVAAWCSQDQTRSSPGQG